MSRPEVTRPATTVRITADSHQRLRELAEWRGESLQDTLGEAIDRLWRDFLFEELDAYYAELRSDPRRWQKELDERKAWAAIEHWDDE